MKLRLEDDSLRLRLSTEDLAQFAQTGRVAVTVPLAPGPTGRLSYALQQTPDSSTAAEQALRVAYTPGALEVLVPAALAQGWLQPGEVGLEGRLDVADGQTLRIIVEKDFKG
ncbi:hypothetical protein EJV47_20385 [Hymenobacter gummosus]|uniref:Uncharacterized protein n=1 Tax=Hymenobacter gummosus TaxID=1776032 RepID=A0A431TY41_9BACT|nr:hypothetical protein [Hymenobacter gummosus]RTQ46735.1 hypothetical protein EJV47_20385 [Hymenobacter gummosus]